MLDFTLDEVLSVFDRGTALTVGATLLFFAVPLLVLSPPVPVRISEALEQTHSKLGLPASETNLPSRAEEVPEDEKPRVRSLLVYPVKSCHGVELTRAKVVPEGLQHDRIYTLARLRDKVSADGEPVWEMISQRQFPKMAKLSVDVWCPDPAKTRGQLSEQGSDETFLILRYPWARPGFGGVLDWVYAKLGKGWRAVPEKEILLPVNCPSEAEIEKNGYKFELLSIWKDTIKALNMGKELPEELGGLLGVNDRIGLFRMGVDGRREVYRCAPRKEEAGYQPVIKFQDAYPIHIMNVASVRDVEKQIANDTLEDFDVLRFRPNVIITGPPPYDEDTWKSFRLEQGTASVTSDCTYHVSCRTARCKLPNVNPKTGVRHPVEPDRYLRKHRNVDKGAPMLGCLGMMLTPIFPPSSENVVGNSAALESWIEVGMEIDVLQRGEHFYIPQ